MSAVRFASAAVSAVARNSVAWRVMTPRAKNNAAPAHQVHVNEREKANFRCDNNLKRPAHSTEQPSDTERYDRGGIGLSFDCVSQPVIKCCCGLSGDISSLAAEILRSTSRLVYYAFSFCLYVTRGATDVLLHLAADVARCSFNTILIHGDSPAHGTRGLYECSCATRKPTRTVDLRMTISTMSFDVLMG